MSISASSVVPVLQQLTEALSALVQALQAQSVTGGGAPATGQAEAGASTLQSPEQLAPGGCGCGGGMQAVEGVGGLGAPEPAYPTLLMDRPTGARPTGSDDVHPITTPIPTTASVSAPAPAPTSLVSGPTRHSRQENARVVADVATKLGVDPVLAVATMLVESNGNNMQNTGDGATSFGLFQLHIGGELPKAWYPGQPGHVNAFDPRKNAEEALARFAHNKGRYSGAELAFRSQRPANHDAYVAAIDKRMPEARKLLGM